MFSGKLRLSEGDDDFVGDVESSRSNLSNIFGVPLLKGEDSSLKYVSPKQENPIESSVKPAAWSVQVAKVVSAFKLVDQTYALEGKVGLALLKSLEDLYKIILYRDKSKILSTFTISENSKVFIRKPYFQFCDDMQVFWSVLFEGDGENEIIALISDKIKVEECKDEASSLDSEEICHPCKGENPHTVRKDSVDATKTPLNSSNETLSESKAKLLSRMAKMGKPLPKLSATTTDFSDSSDTEVKTKLFTKPVAVPRKPKAQQFSTTVSSITQLIPAGSTLAAYNPNLNAETQCLNMLVTENRTQNAEIRINMTKLEAKIEKVLDKIDTIDTKSVFSCGKHKEDEILELEEKLLTLKKENRALKVKIEEHEKSSRSTEVKRYGECEAIEFDHLIKMFNLNKDDYETLEDLLKDLLRHYSNHCESLKSSLDSSKLEDYKQRVQLLELEKEKEVSKILEENEKLRSNICDMEHKMEKLKAESQELVMGEQSAPASDIQFDSALKDVMNNFYQLLVVKFGDKKNFSTTEILRICGAAIKEETSNIINKKNCCS